MLWPSLALPSRPHRCPLIRRLLLIQMLQPSSFPASLLLDALHRLRLRTSHLSRFDRISPLDSAVALRGQLMRGLSFYAQIEAPIQHRSLITLSAPIAGFGWVSTHEKCQL